MGHLVSKCRYLAFLLKEQTSLYVAALRDARRYARVSHTGFARHRKSAGRIQGRLIATGHVLEKGLSMAEMRPRFGIGTVQSLLGLLEAYREAGGDISDPHYAASIGTLRQYVDRHRELGIDVSDIVPDAAMGGGGAPEKGGVFRATPERSFANADAPFEAFAESRHSTRNFDQERAVPRELLERAVRIALRSPSACNRQPWKVYAFTERPAIRRLMAHHEGSRGFGPDLPCLLVVGARMDTFSGIGERNQTYVDGGLFAMTLMFALHHLRLGCVPLNWSVDPARDRRMKAEAGISDDENIIMLVGCGYPAKQSMVPRSERRAPGEVLRFPAQETSEGDDISLRTSR